MVHTYIHCTEHKHVDVEDRHSKFLALLKPGSQYDTGAYVAPVASVNRPGSQYDTGAYVAPVASVNKPGSQYDTGAYAALCLESLAIRTWV